jgi:hypothetical protein
MLFENIDQFKKAKETLIEMEGDIEMTTSLLREMEEFDNLSDTDIKFAVIELYEGLGDKILNFVSSSFGGDIKSLKTVLTQMKEQELKFNEEEYKIHDEFYDLLAKERQLRKDKTNPDYSNMLEDISQRKKALNVRMNELTKMHDDIFNALELKVKDLTGKSNRKKKYFNAQRANDVLLTKNDRYEKIKAITQKSNRREKDLEDFFGVTKEEMRKDVQDARENAAKAENSLDGQEKEPEYDSNAFVAEPEKSLANRLNNIDGLGDDVEKLMKLKSLKNEIRGIFMGPEYKMYKEEQKRNIHSVYDQVSRKIKDLSK